MILVTGGGGLLGLNLARALVDKGKEVLLLSWFHERAETLVPPFLAPFWGNQVKEVKGDVLEWPSISSLIGEYPIESIVHAAGIWPGRVGTTSLYHVVSVDIVGTLNILELAHIHGLRRVTFISSVNVYFGLGDQVEGYEDAHLPVLYPDAIGATKKASEQICHLYANRYQLSVPIIRVARIYGPTAHWRINPVETMVTSAVEGAPADCLDTYEGSYLCLVHAKDCGEGISLIHLAKKLKYDVYNLADGNYVTYREVADIVEEFIPDADIRLATDREADRSYAFQPVNIERIRAEGWIPQYADLRKGIKAYIDYLRHGSVY